MKRFATLALLMTTSLTSIANFAMGAEARKDAIVDLKNVDVDYHFQGEYAGEVFTATGRTGWINIGLQVTALGDGKFDAMAYAGGLPGSGGQKDTRVKLQGEFRNGIVELEGSNLHIESDEHHAIVWVSGMQTGGYLSKVHRFSPTLNAAPPAGATVLFDGTDTRRFKNGRMTADGLLMEGTETLDAWGDFTLHLEFRLPYMPIARGQGRSNSGVYLQSRYEVQILDSFGLDGLHNECGGLYKQREPDINMCLPPLTWQTYDIAFTSPKFDADNNKIENARITIRHNGYPIHNNVEITNKTGAGQPEGIIPLPTKLQDHGNPVRFRNIWIVNNRTSPPSMDLPIVWRPNRSVPGWSSPVMPGQL